MRSYLLFRLGWAVILCPKALNPERLQEESDSGPEDQGKGLALSSGLPHTTQGTTLDP